MSLGFVSLERERSIFVSASILGTFLGRVVCEMILCKQKANTWIVCCVINVLTSQVIRSGGLKYYLVKDVSDFENVLMLVEARTVYACGTQNIGNLYWLPIN
jgi:hypothetical protein